MKKLCKFTKIGLVLVLCLCMLCGTAAADDSGTFPDIPAGAPYEEAVEVLAELGIIIGDGEGNFNPNNTITRAEAATIICRLLGVEDEAKAIRREVFLDVPVSHWSVGYVAKAAELGIIVGHGDGTFGPDDPVTQEQMIKMIVCTYDLTELAENAGGYPQGYIEVAQDYGITNGTVILPSASALRSTIAVWVYNAMYN